MVSCCMEAFICLWYHVLKMMVVDVNGYNQIIGVNGCSDCATPFKLGNGW